VTVVIDTNVVLGKHRQQTKARQRARQRDYSTWRFHPRGRAAATRYLDPVAECDEDGAVTDPDTGLPFGNLRYNRSAE